MTKLELAYQEELKQEKQLSESLANTIRSIEGIYSNKLQEIANGYTEQLQEIANGYTQKLKELCQSEPSEEQQENTLAKQLEALQIRFLALENDLESGFKKITSNQEELFNAIKNQ